MKYLQCRRSTRTLWATTYRLSWVALLSLLMATPISAGSQTVHALLVIMDADPSLGTAMEVNRENVENLLTTVEHETDLRLEKRMLLSSRNEARKSYVMTWLKEIKSSDNDVVFVYFSGFGGATPQTEKEQDAFVSLQDGEFRQSDFAQKVRDVSNARLKILITDRCKGILKSTQISNHDETLIFSKSDKIRHLFMEHTGFLHLSSATAGEYGWADEQTGSLFTDTLLHAISHPSGSDLDSNGDSFIAWQEIFAVIQQTTADRFQRAYPTLSESLKKLLQEQGSASQIPTSYKFPNPLVPPAHGIESNLWALINPKNNFTVFLNTDSPDYQLNDHLTLRVLVTDDAHIVILNWDSTGKLTLLVPNDYQQNSFVKAGTIHAFPDPQSDFDFLFSGPPGIERFKVIALHRAADSKTITDFFPAEDNSFQLVPIVPNPKRLEIEKKILSYLRQMKPSEWAVAGQAIELREAKLREPPNLGPTFVIPPDYGKGDTVYVKNGSYMYFAEVIGEVNENSETVAVDIFNKALRKKLGDTVPMESVLGRRVEPESGWGNCLVMLSFYQDGKWTFTTDAVVFEDHFLLPKIVNKRPVQGSLEVNLSDARIPIPVSFSSSE